MRLRERLSKLEQRNPSTVELATQIMIVGVLPNGQSGRTHVLWEKSAVEVGR